MLFSFRMVFSQKNNFFEASILHLLRCPTCRKLFPPPSTSAARPSPRGQQRRRKRTPKEQVRWVLKGGGGGFLSDVFFLGLRQQNSAWQETKAKAKTGLMFLGYLFSWWFCVEALKAGKHSGFIAKQDTLLHQKVIKSILVFNAFLEHYATFEQTDSF